MLLSFANNNWFTYHISSLQQLVLPVLQIVSEAFPNPNNIQMKPPLLRTQSTLTRKLSSVTDNPLRPRVLFSVDLWDITQNRLLTSFRLIGAALIGIFFFFDDPFLFSNQNCGHMQRILYAGIQRDMVRHCHICHLVSLTAT